MLLFFSSKLLRILINRTLFYQPLLLIILAPLPLIVPSIFSIDYEFLNGLILFYQPLLLIILAPLPLIVPSIFSFDYEFLNGLILWLHWLVGDSL
jgi:hypothetical protein